MVKLQKPSVFRKLITKRGGTSIAKLSCELHRYTGRGESVEIRFISSLTAEDENQFAPALLKAVGALLDQLPIAYTMRIQTTGAQVFQHTRTHEAPEEETNTAEEAVHSNRLAEVMHHFSSRDRSES